MTLVSTNQYDGNGVGDGSLTQTADLPDTNPADARITASSYDWRDRLVGTKSGVMPTLASVSITNFGCETPAQTAIPPGNFTFAPSGASWTFSSSAGIAGNGSCFTSASAAPQGSQVAFVNQTGYFDQSISGFAVGAYQLAFFAAQRGSGNASQQDFQVQVGGVPVGNFTPVGTAYQLYMTAFNGAESRATHRNGSEWSSAKRAQAPEPRPEPEIMGGPERRPPAAHKAI
jgi:hypothetical protein